MRQLIKHISILILLIISMYGLTMLFACKVDFRGKKLIYSVASYIPKKGGQESLMLAELDEGGDYDVIVLGSSHAYRGYDPRIFEKHGFSMFNAGSSAQSFQTSMHVLENHINLSEVDLVILDIYPVIFEIEGTETAQRFIVDETFDSGSWELVQETKDFRSFNSFVKRIICANDTNDSVVRDYVGKGYCSRVDTIIELPPADTTSFQPREENLKALTELLHHLIYKTRLVLISHPMPSCQRNIDMASVISKCTTESDLVFADYTNEPGYTQDHFSDAYHLNQAGVEKFNEMLINQLIQAGYLTP